jgi:hypothetical protein
MYALAVAATADSKACMALLSQKVCLVIRDLITSAKILSKITLYLVF